ncbi:hypothetical protein ACOJUR_08365 [Alicyclobacillus tolerans]|uniref:hypothetical protein n=1 Tax=Alicyclobacillus tolerans TaxID=90970 RepID=UPI003B7AE445
MAYTSKGRRPNEYASKSSHIHIIRDPAVSEYLAMCDFPEEVSDSTLDQQVINVSELVSNNSIKHVLAIDGGYTEVVVRQEFPSATIALFQLGVNIFGVNDLDELTGKPFVDPDDMAKLKQIQRLKMALPIRNLALKGESSLIDSVRRTVYDVFRKEPSADPVHDRLIETLRWFIYEEYSNDGSGLWSLSNCPSCGMRDISLNKSHMSNQYTFSCPGCNGTLFLTDVFRLHEAVDNELGAGGILGYVTTLMEQMLIVHLIRLILKTQPALLNEMLFLKDGPLAFFGQTANMHQPMRKLCVYLMDHRNVFLAGMEKSGPFVDHADQLAPRLENGSLLLLSNKYIYRHILPGNADDSNPYARTSYYGAKMIYKSHEGQMYVITVPTRSAEVVINPKLADFHNINCILLNIDKLKCDMYDSSLIPIALVNKLVSLAHHPSSLILEKFVRSSMHRN